MSEILNEGYKLFVDNWNSSLYLLNYLYNNDTVRCGNARSNCVQLLKSFNTPSKDQFTYPQNDKLLAVSYLDKKDIFFYPLCTIYKTFARHKLINDYNKYMSGADKNDALVGSCTCIQKTYKCTRNIFSITLNR